MNLCVIGTGYVGLVTGTCLAEIGHNIWCVDVDQNKIDKLNSGQVPFFEPGLDKLIQRNVKAGRLRFTTRLEDAIAPSKVAFIAVGTPPGEDGSADLTYVMNVARDIGCLIINNIVIVNKSTVPFGSADKVQQVIQNELNRRGQVDLVFEVISNPEFLKEGDAIQDFMFPDRIIIGTEDDGAFQLMEDIYNPIISSEHPLIRMDVRSAELTKYAANAMLASRISFMNEMAALCDVAGADIEQIRMGIGADRRIGNSFLRAGLGYGGSCFPKDVQALLGIAAEYHVQTHMMEAIESVNQSQKSRLLEMVLEHFGTDLSGKTFAVWGLAFKPGTDDMREAASIYTIRGLLEYGATIQAHDPVALDLARRILGHRKIDYYDDFYATIRNADALLLITEWLDYHNPDYQVLKKTMRQPIIFDGRNLYDPDLVMEQGFKYYSIGRNKRYA